MMVYKCPHCHGLGSMSDGTCKLDASGLQWLVSPSTCPICEGKKAVFIRPATDEEAKLAFAVAHVLGAAPILGS